MHILPMHIEPDENSHPLKQESQISDVYANPYTQTLLTQALNK
jgi:hypothetical protein